jgi:hypothetical protein
MAWVVGLMSTLAAREIIAVFVVVAFAALTYAISARKRTAHAAS